MKVDLDKNLLENFCIKNHIVKLSIFGSALRRDFTDKSDIDFLVDFEEDHIPGFFKISLNRRRINKDCRSKG